MLVLGIDPGIAITGYGLVTVDPEGNPALVAFGVINATAVSTNSSRLLFIYQHLHEIIAEYQPTHAAMEKIFFQKNLKTVSAVSEARGVITLCLEQAGLPIAEYTPNEVKLSVTSYGNAGKAQVQEMVRVLLWIDAIPKPDDAADALAVAMCHIGYINFTNHAADGYEA